MAKKVKRQPLGQDRQVRALKPDEEMYEHAIKDCKGLRIRVYPSGRKSWLYRYRHRETGQLKRMIIGEYKARGMSLADARAEADRQRAIANEHGSALEFRDKQIRESRAALAEEQTKTERDAYTVEKLIYEYVEHASRELKSWTEVDRALRAYITPEIGKLSAHEVGRDAVSAALEKLHKRGKKVQANRTLAYLRRAFNWAIEQGKVSSNPCDRIKRSKEVAKERHLGDAELRRFLNHLPDSGIEPMMQDFYRLLLLTALRPGEVASLAFDNFDPDGTSLYLATTKSGEPHALPVSKAAYAIVERRREATDSTWLFPMRSNEKRHVRGDMVQRPLREAIPKLKVLPLTPHDLRRTAATGLSRLKAPRLLVSMILNHADGSMTARYDRHHYWQELHEWLEVWANHVGTLTNSSTGSARNEEAA